ncbi:MAG: hypothetical protein DDT34_00550 [Firmicutes bacterium]|nr:hypothetical protein [Bacillota bacterium]
MRAEDKTQTMLVTLARQYELPINKNEIFENGLPKNQDIMITSTHHDIKNFIMIAMHKVGFAKK